MASSQNLPALEPFLFHTFPDSWISEAYARDTQTLTRALQSTFNSISSDLIVNPIANLSDSAAAAPPTSSSDPDSAPPPIKRRAAPGATGKVTKRKSRASKRSQTTFITADPANFRQMVQQVTGVRFSGGQLPVVPGVLKPEPQRLGSRLIGGSGCLPTLDTSAFLLENRVFGSGSDSGCFGQPGGGSEGRVDLDCVSSFPTLESWN